MFISEAEAQHATCIREAKANCASIIAEAENCCSTAIREAGPHNAKWPYSIQQSYAKGMQHLETEDIEEEGKDCLSFPTACRTALQACPLKPIGCWWPSFHLLMGNMPLPTLLNVPPRYPPWICPTSHSLYCPHGIWALAPIQMATPLPSWAVSLPGLEATLEWPLRSHPTWSKGMRCPFTKHWQGAGRKPLPCIQI